MTVAVPGGTGSVSITEQPVAADALAGFVLLGRQVQIEAPTVPADSPMTFTFAVDDSLLSAAGVGLGDLAVLRNGVVVAPCEADPCVVSREHRTGTSTNVITVRTTHASTWAWPG